MRFSKVTAIIPRESLERVECTLRELGVPAITVTRAKGYGEYKNFFTHDWKVGTARIEIFTTRGEAEPIALAIVDAAHTEFSGAAGIVAILPVERLYHIRTGALATEADICCCRDNARQDQDVP